MKIKFISLEKNIQILIITLFSVLTVEHIYIHVYMHWINKQKLYIFIIKNKLKKTKKNHKKQKYGRKKRKRFKRLIQKMVG